MSEAMANVAVACGVALAGVSLLLCGIGLASYFRLRHARLLWVAVALAFLAVQGALLTDAAYADRGAIASGDEPFPWPIGAGLGVAVALYLAVLKR